MSLDTKVTIISLVHWFDTKTGCLIHLHLLINCIDNIFGVPSKLRTLRFASPLT